MMTLAILVVAWATGNPTWSNEVAVHSGNDAVVRYQARIENDYVIVKATHEQGWHTYAMDNELRALAALQGKKSLGIEKGIDIKVESGLEMEGPWLQTKPSDLSKPELRWFTFGFDETAMFARRVKQRTSDQVTLRVRGQACSGETCCNVDIILKIEEGNQPVNQQSQSPALPIAKVLKELVPVETQNDPSPRSE